MKELHNHIFSNTTCISKEIMLRYINKQLSKNELYEVEKHMLDCELCSDAYEGIKFAENSSILFAIDNQIDQRVAKGNTKAPIMRNLMMAASILVIAFGTYFTFNFFNTTINNGKGLAVNEINEPNQEEPIEEHIILDEEKEKEKEQGWAASNSEWLNTIIDADKRDDSNKDRITMSHDESVLAEQAPVINDIVYDMEEVEEEVAVSGSLASNERLDKAKGEAEKSTISNNGVNLPEFDNRGEDDFSNVIQAESITSNVFESAAQEESIADKSGESLKKETKKKNFGTH